MDYSGPSTKTKINGREVVLLGTAHVSQKSVEDVENAIKKEKPNVVAVELCQTRYNAIQDPERWRNLDIVKVIRDRKLYLLMSSMILSAFQKKIGDHTEVKPGQEMLTALELAKEKKISLKLVDRDVQITLKRAWQTGGYFTKTMLISELLTSLIFTPPTSSEEIEKMKQEDILDTIFKEFPVRYEKIKDVIITERDQYIAQKIKDAVRKMAKNERLVAIIGAGHLKGVQKHLKKNTDIKKLEKVKETSRLVSTIKFFLPIILIASIFLYFTGLDDPQKILHAWTAWVLIKSLSSGMGALLMLAHPWALLAAMLVAPISNFNPVLKPGWVAALLEAKFRKPKVADFENFASDTSTFKGFFRNKVSRIFGTFTLPQLGSSIGTGIALWYIST